MNRQDIVEKRSGYEVILHRLVEERRVLNERIRSMRELIRACDNLFDDMAEE